MPDARPVKTEIQVRYSPMLQFSSVIRRLMGKYGGLDGVDLNIQNQNQLEERIIAGFQSEEYFFDCTWRRAAFAGQGRRDGYKRRDGKVRFFFDLVEDIGGLDFFTRFDALTLLAFDTIPLKMGNDMTSIPEKPPVPVGDFANAFLSPRRPKLSETLTDAGLTLEWEEDNPVIRCNLGPFNPSKDIENFNLVIFESEQGPMRPDWAKVPSLLMRTEIVYSGRHLNHNTYLKCNDMRQKVVESVFSSLKHLENGR